MEWYGHLLHSIYDIYIYRWGPPPKIKCIYIHKTWDGHHLHSYGVKGWPAPLFCVYIYIYIYIWYHTWNGGDGHPIPYIYIYILHMQIHTDLRSWGSQDLMIWACASQDLGILGSADLRMYILRSQGLRI